MSATNGSPGGVYWILGENDMRSASVSFPCAKFLLEGFIFLSAVVSDAMGVELFFSARKAVAQVGASARH